MSITVIIPVHEFNDNISNYLSNAVESVMIQEDVKTLPEIMIVSPTSIIDDIKGFVDSQKRKFQDKINIKIIINENETDFQSQINLGVKSTVTDYFSILELDDEFNRKYFKNVNKYIKYKPDVDIFLSIIIEVDTKGNAQKFTNEFIWAQMAVGENGEIGFLNSDVLKQNSDIKISGSVMKTDSFKVIGGLKKNIKLTFNYEFILRAINNGLTVYTIPKLGYKHLNGRENSLFLHLNEELSLPERKFWFDNAIKESNFITERPINLDLLYMTEKK
jgi:GT2 family glycosyltransferase